MKYMTPKVPSSDSGTTMAGTRVLRQSRKNANVTSVTSKIEAIRLISTSRNEARMVVVRSIKILSLIEAGIDACRNGSSALTASTVSITLAPGCLKITSSTDGWPLYKP